MKYNPVLYLYNKAKIGINTINVKNRYAIYTLWKVLYIDCEGAIYRLWKVLYIDCGKYYTINYSQPN